MIEEQIENEYDQLKSEFTEGVNLGAWWTWTQAEFQAWCDTNLMTDAQIDTTNLSAALKTNLKANNTYTRNSGRLLIVARNVVKWLVRKIV